MLRSSIEVVIAGTRDRWPSFFWEVKVKSSMNASQAASPVSPPDKLCPSAGGYSRTPTTTKKKSTQTLSEYWTLGKETARPSKAAVSLHVETRGELLYPFRGFGG